MSISDIATLIIAFVGGGWSSYKFVSDKRHYIREKKAEYYQRVLAAEEELHEAYFEGQPVAHSTKLNKGWYESIEGWRHVQNWVKSDRYLAAARDMNWCLAGISLFSTDEIISICGDLENISRLSEWEEDENGDSRTLKMNKLLNLMRKDLDNKAGIIIQEWA